MASGDTKTGLTRDRWYAFRVRVQLRIYQAWCWLMGKPAALGVKTPGVVEHVVTRQIPGISVRLFGRRIWLIVPVALEFRPREPQRHRDDK